MDSVDGQSAPITGPSSNIFAPIIRQGAGARTVLGTVGLTVAGSSTATVHGTVTAACGPMVGRNGSSDTPWFVLVMILGRSGQGAAAVGDRDGRYGRGQALAAPEPRIVHYDYPPIDCRQYRVP
jgi:hypothetical protein